MFYSGFRTRMSQLRASADRTRPEARQASSLQPGSEYGANPPQHEKAIARLMTALASTPPSLCETGRRTRLAQIGTAKAEIILTSEEALAFRDRINTAKNAVKRPALPSSK